MHRLDTNIKKSWEITQMEYGFHVWWDQSIINYAETKKILFLGPETQRLGTTVITFSCQWNIRTSI